MSAIAHIAEGIRETGALISQTEREIKERPDDPTLLLNIQSLQKRLRRLEKEFAELAEKDFIDICDYRLITPSDEYSVSAVSEALSTFQRMITVFFDAIRTGPKSRAQISPDIARLSSFSFAYSYPGSLGFTLTAPNERLLAVDSDLDLAIEKAFEVMQSLETSDLAGFANELGIASIRSAYNWAEKHARYGLSANIRWKRGSETRNEAVITSEQLDRLAHLIDQTGDEEEEDVVVSGRLVGIDESLGTFHFIPSEGDEIKGHLSEDFSFAAAIPVPSYWYEAEFRIHKAIHFSIEKVEVTWTLKDLRHQE